MAADAGTAPRGAPPFVRQQHPVRRHLTRCPYSVNRISSKAQTRRTLPGLETRRKGLGIFRKERLAFSPREVPDASCLVPKTGKGAVFEPCCRVPIILYLSLGMQVRFIQKCMMPEGKLRHHTFWGNQALWLLPLQGNPCCGLKNMPGEDRRGDPPHAAGNRGDGLCGCVRRREIHIPPQLPPLPVDAYV